MNDHVNFLRQWAASPMKVAAIAPSGKRLGRLMTEGLDASTAPVIELGPGTGVFTEAMIARGVPEDKIALVELNEAFAHGLSTKFPHQAQLGHNKERENVSFQQVWLRFLFNEFGKRSRNIKRITRFCLKFEEL